MYNVNGLPATLIKNNRGTSDFYDDQDKTEEDIKVCPYTVDQAVRFGVYTVPEATGYFSVKNNVDVKEGDQIVFREHVYSVLKVEDNWLWNKIANIGVVVK